ncbi:MAG: DUF697 domain-containing protein [Prolixibacteraceae bacterium]|jgi:uncharacterized protein (DUF697 family)|nr:DUF697 domain-containing protein [Prolixibacteraceae bacterium]
MEKETINETVLENKQKLANGLTKRYMWWTMGAGLIPIPFVDLVAVSGVQLKMLRDMAKIYEVKFNETQTKSIVTALLGSIVPNALSTGGVGSILKMVPLVGSILGGLSMSLFSGAATYAMGKVFIQHFEAGGTLLDFDPEKVKEYFKSQFEEGQNVAEDMKKNNGKQTGKAEK